VDVLLHFRDMPDKDKFGMIGFHRLNGFDNSKRAYKRTHVASTVLLNLNKLSRVDYHWRAHVWEDHQFNREAELVDAELEQDEEKRAVLCKCYRFAFSSPQVREGGCAYMVARGSGKDVDPSRPPDLPATEVPKDEPINEVHADSSIKEVSRWVRGLKKLGEVAEECAQKFELEEIDGYTLFNVLNSQYLQEMGFPVGRRGKILKEIESLEAGAGSSAAAVGAASSGDNSGGSRASSGQSGHAGKASHASVAGGGRTGNRIADSSPPKKKSKVPSLAPNAPAASARSDCQTGASHDSDSDD
jgi:hypothetical protein